MSDNYVAIASAARSSVVDAAALDQALRRHIRGDVRFDSSSRALYATDGSNYRQVPIGVVLPRDADDVIAAVSLAREYGAPLLCRGSGTSLAGQCCNVALVLDFTRYMGNILEIDPQRRTARVQPGVVLDHLRNAAEKHHLTFGPDPASHDRCTLGGMIGNNSCGVHSVMAGKTDDNIEALEILTYDGLRMKVGKTSDAELEQIIRDGGRRGEIYAGLKKLRDQYARSRAPALSQYSAAGVGLQPQLPAARKWFRRSPRAGRVRRHLRLRARGHVPPGGESSGASAAGDRLSRHLPVRRPCARCHGPQADRPRGH